MPITNRQRLRIWDRDEGVCQALHNGVKCGRPGSEVHHIVPRSQGGTDEDDNLQVKCLDCHHTFEVDGWRYMGHLK